VVVDGFLQRIFADGQNLAFLSLGLRDTTRFAGRKQIADG